MLYNKVTRNYTIFEMIVPKKYLISLIGRSQQRAEKVRKAASGTYVYIHTLFFLASLSGQEQLIYHNLKGRTEKERKPRKGEGSVCECTHVSGPPC